MADLSNEPPPRMVSKIAAWIPVPRFCMWCNQERAIAAIIGFDAVCAECADPHLRALDEAFAALVEQWPRRYETPAP